MRKWFRRRRQPEPLTFHFPNGPVYLHVGSQLSLAVDGVPWATLRLINPKELTLVSGAGIPTTKNRIEVDYSLEMEYGK